MKIIERVSKQWINIIYMQPLEMEGMILKDHYNLAVTQMRFIPDMSLYKQTQKTTTRGP
jgi:hypothetical protein